MPDTNLKERLSLSQPLLVPGVYDALTALLAQQAGFEALYLSGASIAYARLGRSDVGLVTATEVADTVASIVDRVDLPLIVDADTGWGNALNTQRTVRAFERAGAAMLQLEDQTFPKRCGHLAGKEVIPVAEMCGKLRAALDARRSASTLIMARTDALAVEGWNAAVDRAEAYLACGIDALFIEALRTQEQLSEAGQRFGSRIPLLANMIEGGKTPIHDTDSLGRMGYRIVIYPGGTSRAVGFALQKYFGSLKAHGTTAPMREHMLDFDGLNAVIGTTELLELGRRY
ncbi:carboxyvinyl-carboxyphosphonate phosphorylmutase [Pseudoxanthomonas yeongjuensis]|uniref:isocitrate lyase/PEP mutase family protein n=1 Tax=Pseudoxanthomonas yeongjuensis TaxID=377616 RepID=UPI001391C559|nr:isocitrate lyase/phosphoenolpyruvate mutase family protein [Pseudoxanthomonas yeongjuensis]KAF1714603.1 carboxyvinyl-carboxyphosphonate phosphorylmutase [Pseudoxanthomonas yeongjuensis]